MLLKNYKVGSCLPAPVLNVTEGVGAEARIINSIVIRAHHSLPAAGPIP